MQAFKELVNTRDDVKKYSINKVILFGSRARGDNTERVILILILLYMAEILILFIGMLKKKYILF